MTPLNRAAKSALSCVVSLSAVTVMSLSAIAPAHAYEVEREPSEQGEHWMFSDADESCRAKLFNGVGGTTLAIFYSIDPFQDDSGQVRNDYTVFSTAKAEKEKRNSSVGSGSFPVTVTVNGKAKKAQALGDRDSFAILGLIGMMGSNAKQVRITVESKGQIVASHSLNNVRPITQFMAGCPQRAKLLGDGMAKYAFNLKADDAGCVLFWNDELGDIDLGLFKPAGEVGRKTTMSITREDWPKGAPKPSRDAEFALRINDGPPITVEHGIYSDRDGTHRFYASEDGTLTLASFGNQVKLSLVYQGRDLGSLTVGNVQSASAVLDSCAAN